MRVLSYGLSPWVTAALVLYWIFVVIIIIAEDREPTTTLAWILMLILLPIVGLVLYFFAGRDWKHTVPKRVATKMAKATALEFMTRVYEPYLDVQADFVAAAQGTVTGRITTAIAAENDQRPLPIRSQDIYPTGKEFFENLKKDMAAAKHFINLEYFIWEKDELTADLCEILIDRVKAGVEVHVLYDWMGSLPFGKSELNSLKMAGGDVRPDVTQLGSLNYRNHRKIAVIDGEIGYTGGHNVGQEYIDGGKSYPSWRDTSTRVTGPGVAMLMRWFAYRWLIAFKDDGFWDPKYFPAVDESLTHGSPLMAQVVAQGVDDPWESSRRTHMIAMSGAEKTLRISSPYFVPDVGTYDAMINAALGGVDVRFIMTGWPDHKSAFWAAQSYWRPLVEAGGHVYTYEAGFFHAKSMAVDSQLCAIGTMNLDLRSLKLQRELMLWTFDAEKTRELEAIFDRDLEKCKEITLKDLNDMSAFVNFRNSASRLGANLL